MTPETIHDVNHPVYFQHNEEMCVHILESRERRLLHCSRTNMPTFAMQMLDRQGRVWRNLLDVPKDLEICPKCIEVLAHRMLLVV